MTEPLPQQDKPEVSPSQTSKLFELTCRFTSVGFLGLAGALVVKPSIVLGLFSVPSHAVGDFVAKRAAMVVLCPVVLCHIASDKAESNPELKQTVATSMAVSMAGLTAVGLYEYFRGFAGPGIWAAIALEADLMLFFGAVASGWKL